MFEKASLEANLSAKELNHAARAGHPVVLGPRWDLPELNVDLIEQPPLTGAHDRPRSGGEPVQLFGLSLEVFDQNEPEGTEVVVELPAVAGKTRPMHPFDDGPHFEVSWAHRRLWRAGHQPTDPDAGTRTGRSGVRVIFRPYTRTT